jgi:small subunit ribosomal protein S6
LETVIKKLYEGLFLVDAAEAAADWQASLATIKNILERADAEIVSIRKWDEYNLAYKINGKDRGVYVLCYFRAEGGKIRDIERDVQLSERIMRVLILCAEHMTQEDIEKETPVMRAEKSRQKAAQGAAEESGELERSAERLAAGVPGTEQSVEEKDYLEETDKQDEEETDIGEVGEIVEQ